MLAGAMRRLAVLLAGVSAVTAAASVVIGVALGSSVDRSVSIGFYIVGSFLLVGAFFIGNRGPLRSIGQQGLFSIWGRTGVRPVKPEERREEINVSVIFLCVGLFLILIGITTDSRVRLF
jgi:hypothetical protein